jgi:hypothetical protein
VGKKIPNINEERSETSRGEISRNNDATKQNDFPPVKRSEKQIA